MKKLFNRLKRFFYYIIIYNKMKELEFPPHKCKIIANNFIDMNYPKF
jgi:hypothetical protein